MPKLKITMTEEFEKDFELWLLKHVKQPNGVHYKDLSEEDKIFNRENFGTENYIEWLLSETDEKRPKFDPHIRLREQCRVSEDKYVPFKIKRSHFVTAVQFFDPWTSTHHNQIFEGGS